MSVRGLGGGLRRQPGHVLLGLGHRDGRTLGVVEAVHGAELHDHVQAVREDQNHEQARHQTHPDPRGEETCTVTCIREVPAAHVEALDLNREHKQTQT